MQNTQHPGKIPNFARALKSHVNTLIPFKVIPKLDVLVCSHGGVATTTLLENLSNYVSVNDPYDKDGLKHLPKIPIWLPSDTKIIYVYGDPVYAAMSLFRRGYGKVQAGRNGQFVKDRVFENVSTYAKSGYDHLGLIKHLSNWALNSSKKHDVLIIEYSKIWENLESIRSFVECSDDFVSKFPEHKQRKSRQECSEDVIVAIKEIYAEYTCLSGEIGDFKISPKINF
ncbi:MAG: hypothetical protein ACSHXL_00875 [Bacteroidota bacterium]